MNVYFIRDENIVEMLSKYNIKTQPLNQSISTRPETLYTFDDSTFIDGYLDISITLRP
ncbi:hypothetical protein PIROE2DRAFT_10428 [Piromyces sp. E2]|nr:hypothetical protein PIROE2DRAFT_10428 [Piromyces sp. E2]|eukprot:OUM63117.1 hypothetical protein PIROE2DRAFT_10428 [Piromyces sp. E2]